MKHKEHQYVSYRKNNEILDIEIIDLKINLNQPFETRETIRGICIKDDSILVVYPKDELIYGIPGGGIDRGENHFEALKREMNEEVGASSIKIIKPFGRMTCFRKMYDSDQIFVPTHNLYLIDIEAFEKQNLIDYELSLGLSYKFVNIDEAIKTNELALSLRNQEYLDFYSNQTVLLKLIKQFLF